MMHCIVRVLLQFYCERMKDFTSALPVLKGLHTLVRLSDYSNGCKI